MPGYITVEPLGGLGNQLFQIATTYACAKRNGYNYCFLKDFQGRQDRPPVWTTYLKDNKWPLLNSNEHNMISWTPYQEHRFHYDLIKLSHKYNNYKLHGYFQSSQYFNDYKDDIRSLLQPSAEALKGAHDFLKSIGIHTLDGWIVAHVRRGDYIQASQFHEVTTPTYFKGARTHIESIIRGRRSVCWITDDPQWVYEHLYQDADKVISNDSIQDFICLSQFRYMILSNSSYSWWAAWLNPSEPIICCPNKWFGSSGPQDYESVFEPDWIRIDTTSGKAIAQDFNQVQGSNAGH